MKLITFETRMTIIAEDPAAAMSVIVDAAQAAAEGLDGVTLARTGYGIPNGIPRNGRAVEVELVDGVWELVE